ncbi:hypothetical protein LK540_07470 [Massilia sp. IC2-278]|uniref:hypothetical protein n=1 Tax=Massilia sp. IC2-278 TaxID=2887200 RepID=UPI001E5EEF55|nr:hypothetical protein [Massilia sp. IC2-278]MCC2960268.1 hypothetical protein [Massilia sp. IC2-278]
MNDSPKSFSTSVTNDETELPELLTATTAVSEALKKIASHMLWIIIGILALVGAAMLIMSSGIHVEPPILHHVFRDIGIAIIVAAIITAVYETYARIRFELLLMTSFLGAVIADWSRQDIWNALKSQIIEKPVVRENFRVAVRLEHDSRVAQGQMVLKMQVSYNLRGLRSRSTTTKIEHFLDWHFKIKDQNLPCFSNVKVGGKKFTSTDPCFTTKGEFICSVNVPAKDRGAVSVSSSREEVVYFPGTHCFVLNEITKGLEICLNDIPEDITLFVTVRPHPDLKYRELKLTSGEDQIKVDDIVLFPGQIIELLFQPKQQDVVQPDTVV